MKNDNFQHITVFHDKAAVNREVVGALTSKTLKSETFSNSNDQPNSH